MSNTPPLWTPPGAQAREARTAKLVPVEISSMKHNRARVVVRNISSHGLGLKGDLDLIACERLVLHLPDGRDINATVRWVRKGGFGIYLDEQIESSDFQVRGDGTPNAINPRDSQPGFQVMRRPSTNTGHTGFQRTHRDEVLKDLN